MNRLRLTAALVILLLPLTAVDGRPAVDCTTRNCAVDFLFVIDNSDSMAAHQASLADAADELANQLATAGIDWRLAVAYSDLRTTDAAGMGTTCAGAPGPGSHVLCPFTRDITLFRDGSVQCAYAHPGTCGNGTERGFNPLRFALERFEAGTGCEAVTGGECGLRADANLVVVFVTDTGEQTPDGPPPPGTPNTAAAWGEYFRARGVDAIHGIDCPIDPTPENPAPCGDSGIPAADYDRYRDVIAAFAGIEASILDSSFGDTIRQIIDAPPNTATTTTTTTPPNVCPLCDDRDPCTTDSCRNGACVHAQAAGLAAVTCLLDGFCGDAPLPARVQHHLDRAKALLARAARPGGALLRDARLLGRASRHLAKAVRVATRLAKHGKLPADCAAELQRALGTARERIRALRLQLPV